MERVKTVLITGANKGIGYETARQLGVMGFTILLGTRDDEKGGEAAARLIKAAVNARHLPPGRHQPTDA
ncbi:SDR family NAD(P)-dependent oxidoreductase [Cohnella ginsengisoli]|uniref:SDR family NAD(P)-dependent oxidoreductase n=1 Tax=Cohnella ginsengisoli TaxID=425004 RepID=UPI0030B8FD37